MKLSVKPASKAFLAPVVYLVLATVWFLLSDALLSHYSSRFSIETARNISIFKNLVFVAATSIFLAFVMNRYVLMTLRSNKKMRRLLKRVYSVSKSYRHNANELDAIFNNTLVGIAFVDSHMVVRRVNGSYCEIMACPGLCSAGMNVSNINEKESLLCSRISGIIHECREKKCPVEVEFLAEFSTGDRKWLQVSVTKIEAVGNMNGFVVVLRDVTVRKENEEKIAYLSHHDFLTGLPNRRFFYDKLEDACTVAKRYDERFGILFMDINNFKSYNDAHGHEFGDAVLKEFARAVKETLRESDVLARIGGDEFAAIVRGVDDHCVCEMICCKLHAKLRGVTDIAGVHVGLSASIGYGVYPVDGREVDSLLNVADRDMYDQKELYRESTVRRRRAVSAPERECPPIVSTEFH